MKSSLTLLLLLAQAQVLFSSNAHGSCWSSVKSFFIKRSGDYRNDPIFYQDVLDHRERLESSAKTLIEEGELNKDGENLIKNLYGLGIMPSEFVRRLNERPSKKSVGFLKSLLKRTYWGIQDRRILNPKFLQLTMLLYVVNTSTMIYFHGVNYGLMTWGEILQHSLFLVKNAPFDLFSFLGENVGGPRGVDFFYQLLALSLTEVALIASVQKGAVKKILSSSDPSQIKKTLEKLLIPGVASIAGFASFSLQGSEIDKVLVKTLFHTLFITFWSQARYWFLYKKVAYPLKDQTSELNLAYERVTRPALDFSILTAAAGVNSLLASATYTSWSDSFESFFKSSEAGHSEELSQTGESKLQREGPLEEKSF